MLNDAIRRQISMLIKVASSIFVLAVTGFEIFRYEMLDFEDFVLVHRVQHSQ